MCDLLNNHELVGQMTEQVNHMGVSGLGVVKLHAGGMTNSHKMTQQILSSGVQQQVCLDPLTLTDVDVGTRLSTHFSTCLFVL